MLTCHKTRKRWRTGLVFLIIQDINELPQIYYNLSIVPQSIFFLHCFSLTGEQKCEKSLKRCWWIVKAYTCNVTLTAKCTCTWLHHPLKLLKMQCFYNVLIIQVSQDGFMFRLIIVCVLGLWFANTVAAKIVIQHSYNHRLHHRLFSSCTYSPHKLPFLCLNKINRLTCFSNCNLSIQLFLCVNFIIRYVSA